MKKLHVVVAFVGLLMSGCDSAVTQSPIGGDETGLTNNDPLNSLLSIDLSSEDSGNSLAGTVLFSDEEPREFVGALKDESAGSNYIAQYRRATENSFSPGGPWVMGARDSQHIYRLSARSVDNGNSLIGVTAYAGEGPIEFGAVRKSALVVYDVQHSGVGDASPDAGAWVLGSRGDLQQYIVAVDIASEDGGATFSGSITYSGEGLIDFKAVRTNGNTYRVENRFGGQNAPWFDVGHWLIGGKNQRCVELKAFSSDNGQTLTGVARYDSETSVAFSAKHSNGVAYLVENQWGGSTAPWRPGGLWVFGG